MRSMGRYPCPRVLAMLNRIRERGPSTETVHKEIKLLSIHELRQLGREIVKGNGAMHVHIDAVRAELARRLPSHEKT